MTQVLLSHLTKQYSEEQTAVDDLSLDIPAGKLTALLGPSGCGKTTILKLIAGLISPTSGDIFFNDESTANVPAEQRGAVMVFQNHLLFPYLNVGENVAFGLKMRGEKRPEIRRKVAEMLELVQLGGYEQRKPSQLSGGQQQRVALARALVVEPRVLLLDEPLSNLDAHLRDEMRDLIRSLQRRKGITTIFVTHDQEEAVMLADQLAFILRGKIQQAAAPRLFYEQPATLEVARFFGAKNHFLGTVLDSVIYTDLGCFRVEKNHLPPGPVQLAILPDHIRIISNQLPEGVIGDENVVADNTLHGKVQSCTYTGTRSRLKVTVKENSFEIVTEASAASLYQEGDELQLYLPPDKLWAFPGD